MKSLILFITLFCINTVAHAQQSFDKLICKEWKLDGYGKGDKRLPAEKEKKNDRMIFYANHKVKSVESGMVQNGIWKYDDTKKMLTIVDNATKEKMEIKIFSINEKQCVFGDPTSADNTQMYMSPVKK